MYSIYTSGRNTPKTKICSLLALARRLAFLAELRHFFVLAAEDLGDLDAGKILRQVGVDIRRRVLDLAVGAAGEFAENDRENHDERHKAQHHQRQLIVQGQHGHENAEDDEACSWPG